MHPTIKEIRKLTGNPAVADAQTAMSALKQLLRCKPVSVELASDAHHLLAWCYWSMQKFDRARMHCLQSLEHPLPAAKTTRYQLMLALIYKDQLHYAKALSIWLAQLRQANSETAPATIATCYQGIGEYYLLNNELERAVSCTRYAYKFARKAADHDTLLKTSLHLLGLIAEYDADESVQILQHCWHTLPNDDIDPGCMAELHHYAAVVMLCTGKLDQAEESVNQALSINMREKMLWGQTQNRMLLARILARKQQYRQAGNLLEAALVLTSSFDQGFLQQRILRLLRDIRTEQGDYAAALAAQEAYHRHAIALQSSLDHEYHRLKNKQMRELNQQLEQIHAQLTENELRERVRMLEKRLQSLSLRSGFDPITCLPDRQAFELIQPRLSQHTQKPIQGYLFGISNLQAINEMKGFDQGNEILSLCGGILKDLQPMLASQMPGWFRYSGQYFVLLSPEEPKADLSGLFTQAFSRRHWPDSPSPQFALSAGPVPLHRRATQVLFSLEPCWQYTPEGAA